MIIEKINLKSLLPIIGIISSIEVLSLDRENGGLISSGKNIKIAQKPSHIEINSELNKAIISDEGSDEIFALDLSTMDKVIAGAEANFSSINIGMKSDRIFLSTRDFGAGEKSYLVALNASADEIKLVNLTDKKAECNFGLSEHPMAVYFPDKQSEPCCGGNKNWLAVASIKGNLMHVGIENMGTTLSLKELGTSVDLTSTRNMSLNQLHVRKMVGGPVLFDSSLKREAECPNNRKMFFVSSFASDRLNPLTLQSHEVEAQGQGCEGEGSAARLGYKRE